MIFHLLFYFLHALFDIFSLNSFFLLFFSRALGIPENELFTACGRTTLLAGVMLPLDGTCRGEWGLVFTSVGDCKLFLWNEEEGTIDITFGNRFNARDAGDSGGRVGPYVDGGQPDLRNLKTYFWSVAPEGKTRSSRLILEKFIFFNIFFYIVRISYFYFSHCSF